MLLKHIFVLIAFVPFVVSNQCNHGDFYWPDKGCCLPTGGPSHTSSPPHGIKCPRDDWYWHDDKKCCVPRHPHHKTPDCPTDWEWDQQLHKCKPCPTSPSPPKHHPSPKPGYNGKKKRSVNTRITRCPSGFEACPVSGLTGDYECLDTATELSSCGGCVTMGNGQDCANIEGAWNVACEWGTCKVYSCEGGYRLDAGKESCVPL